MIHLRIFVEMDLIGFDYVLFFLRSWFNWRLAGPVFYWSMKRYHFLLMEWNQSFILVSNKILHFQVI